MTFGNYFQYYRVLIDKPHVRKILSRMTDYRTVPNPVLQQSKPQAQRRPAPRHNQAVPKYPVHQPGLKRPWSKKRKFPLWLVLIPVGLTAMLLFALIATVILWQLSYTNKILPQVQVAGISVGNMTQAEAIAHLNQQWDGIYLSNATNIYETNPVYLGLTLDAQASIDRAFAQGHSEGGWSAFINEIDIAPVFSIDANTMNLHLSTIAGEIERPARNAGVEFVNGEVRPTEAIYGIAIDIQATINALQSNPSLLADGVLELSMLSVAPSVLDSSPLVAEAEALLSSPLDIRVYDPVTGDSIYWSSMPDVWANWLFVTSNPDSPIGLSLTVDETQVRDYLQGQVNNSLDSSRSLDFDTAVANIQTAFVSGRPQDAFVTVQHNARTHTVQSGENITSIAWDYGIPYLYIMQANGGIESVSVGQQITIPPADYFIDGNVNPNKRIIVSISQQRTYVYENNQLIYEWLSSTGISSSPTWTGVYQILSHESNAYAGNWNLYMPNFMGVYEPVPGSAFTNGFHGFPTRGGGQLLWENSLGTRVTYGCILLSDTHISILYDWAEEGVIVEIRA